MRCHAHLKSYPGYPTYTSFGLIVVRRIRIPFKAFPPVWDVFAIALCGGVVASLVFDELPPPFEFRLQNFGNTVENRVVLGVVTKTDLLPRLQVYE